MYYDSTDVLDPWKTYRVDGTANDLFYLDHTMGFWLYITDVGDGFFTVEGRIPTVTSVQLHTGWNMVGYPSMTSRTLTDALAGTSADVVSVFDSTSPSMLRDIVLPSDELMVAGTGYYVHVTADCVWTVDW